MIIFAYTLSITLIIISLLPLIRNDYWTFRVFEYPRVQKLVLSIFSLFLLYYFTPADSLFATIVRMALAAIILYLSYQILPFTPLWKKQILKVTRTLEDQQIKIMISNVFEDNVNYAGCVQVIKQANPDIVLLLETNEKWANEVSELDAIYPHHIKAPLNNTYGILFYSKFPLQDAKVKYLVEEDIPSVHTQVQLPSQDWVQFYGVHPTPPVPNENPRSTERDKELLLVADMARKSKIPVIVIGDLNDVAWSYTTELFLKMSKLLDPRRGRGFINTFHAHHPLLRFPLDHVFCSTDFKLVKIKRLDNYKSDHFPVFIHLQYESLAKVEQNQHALEADNADVKEAEEKKAKI